MDKLFHRSDVGVVLLLGGIVLAGRYGETLAATLRQFGTDVASDASSPGDETPAAVEESAAARHDLLWGTGEPYRPRAVRIVAIRTGPCEWSECRSDVRWTGCH